MRGSQTEPGSGSGTPPERRDVTASEAAGYAYCAKAWHLQHVLRAPASAAAAARRAEGVARHREHGERVGTLQRVAPRLVRWAALLLALAIALLLLGVLAGER